MRNQRLLRWMEVVMALGASGYIRREGISGMRILLTAICTRRRYGTCMVHGHFRYTGLGYHVAHLWRAIYMLNERILRVWYTTAIVSNACGSLRSSIMLRIHMPRLVNLDGVRSQEAHTSIRPRGNCWFR